MIKQRLILFAIILLFTISSTSGQNTIDFSYKTENVGKLNFRSWFDNVNPIVLETNRKSIFDEIRKVSVNESVILILSNKDVLIFDRQGKFIKKLPKGRGPKEMMFPRDACLSDEFLFVADINRSIKIYDLKGKYIESLNLGFWCNNIEAINDDILLLYAFQDPLAEFSLYKFEVSKSSILENYFRVPELRDKGIMNISPFSKTKSGVSYLNLFSDTIYKFTKSSVRSTYLDFGSHSLPNSYYSKFSEEDSPVFSPPSGKVSSLVRFYEAGSTILFNAHIDPKKTAIFIHNTNNGLTEVGYPATFYIDNVICRKILGMICGSTGEEVVFGMPATYFLKFQDELMNSMSEEEYRNFLLNNAFISEVIAQLTIESNPVLFFVTPNE